MFDTEPAAQGDPVEVEESDSSEDEEIVSDLVLVGGEDSKESDIILTPSPLRLAPRRRRITPKKTSMMSRFFGSLPVFGRKAKTRKSFVSPTMKLAKTEGGLREGDFVANCPVVSSIHWPHLHDTPSSELVGKVVRLFEKKSWTPGPTLRAQAATCHRQLWPNQLLTEEKYQVPTVRCRYIGLVSEGFDCFDVVVLTSADNPGLHSNTTLLFKKANKPNYQRLNVSPAATRTDRVTNVSGTMMTPRLVMPASTPARRQLSFQTVDKPKVLADMTLPGGV
eukprot:CAMPEP_0175898428 /NCGR_PEP_ID=MMETSP0108-20121206/1251_1 /TAXON_ID=195067 ORGANISM="Goniomonas pacifica, Strain CCMP1869" /NCGR_SAMPLE_ID=MMETSP0108 /ASSEMBLY_ACC=CAM_ASM_000204 /LENGTH=278 /DNA_ID=CAMNT_0017219799 /DNA_START=129 /DNA_END=965 /DNA_ORIENTATION=-